MNAQKSEKSRSLTLTKVRQRVSQKFISPKSAFISHDIIWVSYFLDFLALSSNFLRTPLEIFTENNFFDAIGAFYMRFPDLFFYGTSTRRKKFAHRRRPSSMRQFRNHAPVVINCRGCAARFVRWKIAVRPPYEVSALAGTLNAEKNLKLRPAKKKRVIYFIPLRCGEAKDLCTEIAIRL